MKLTVQYYNERENYHGCIDEENNSHRVDLLVDDSSIGTNESLIGKTVEVQSLTPYVAIAHGVKVL